MAIQNEFNQYSLKYRPQTFKEVQGHEKCISDLLEKSKNNNFSKSVLFTGITGTGKTTIQMILVKAMLCENKIGGEPCNECFYCKTLNEGKPLENISIYNGSNLGIDEMRQIEDKTNQHILAKKSMKIFVVDEMQEIPSQRAMKNILKILEKTKDNCYFILGAMDKEKIDKAIIGRSIHYNLELSIKEIGMYLIDIIKKENIQVDADSTLPSMVTTIVENSGGSLRNAVSMLERVIESNITTEAELFDQLGIVSDTKVNDMIKALLQGDVKRTDFKINKIILEQIFDKLIIMYKSAMGVELNPFEKGLVRTIGRSSSDIIENTIQMLGETNNYLYLKNSIIQFILIKILIKNKKLLNK